MRAIPEDKRAVVATRWKNITDLQTELHAHLLVDTTGKALSNSIKRSKLAPKTVHRFLNRGKPYAWMCGPYATTVVGIAQSLGYELKLVKRKR